MKMFIAIAALAACLASCESKEARAKKRCEDTTMAFVMSQNFIKRHLKAPATASFPYSTSTGVSVRPLGNCAFSVIAYVDAENSFGAKLRSHYSIHMEYLPDSNRWRGTEVVIGD